MKKLLLLCCVGMFCASCEPTYVEIMNPPTDASADATDSRADVSLDQGSQADSESDLRGDLSTDQPADALCAGRPDGSHCGEMIEGTDAQLIYRCEAGRLIETAPCILECDVVGGVAQCLSDANEPCFNDADGDYCGGAIGSSDRVHELFKCRGRRTAEVVDCPTWCAPRSGEQPDVCANNAVDPCFDDADGDYCGGYIGSGDRPQSVFTCVDNRTASVADCPAGCNQGRCNPVQNDCLSRPPGTITRGFNACGGGGYHHGIDYGAAQGTPIPAGVSGVVSSYAEGHPNCPYNFNTGTCPGYCINKFNYLKIKVDGGDPRRPGHDLYVYYLHVSRVAAGVGNGARVNKGDVVAYVGNSGCSTGPHIHLETVSVPAGSSAYLQTCNSFDPASILCP